MRPSYTALTQANGPYLLATWHESTRPVALGFDVDEPVTWLGLRVDKVVAGGAQDDRGVVCFVARSRVGGGRVMRLQECSRFVREQERWFYIDGDVRI